MVIALTILRLPEMKERTGAWIARRIEQSQAGQRVAGGDLDPWGQLWGQQVFAESPRASVYAGLRAECEGRRPTTPER